MEKKELKHHAMRLEKAIEGLEKLDEALIAKAIEKNMRLDFVRAWVLAPRSKKDKPMPPIYAFGTSLVFGKLSIRAKLEKDLENTRRNMNRQK